MLNIKIKLKKGLFMCSTSTQVTKVTNLLKDNVPLLKVHPRVNTSFYLFVKNNQYKLRAQVLISIGKCKLLLPTQGIRTMRTRFLPPGFKPELLGCQSVSNPNQPSWQTELHKLNLSCETVTLYFNHWGQNWKCNRECVWKTFSRPVKCEYFSSVTV